MGGRYIATFQRYCYLVSLEQKFVKLLEKP
jgi:hypothetical protein